MLAKHGRAGWRQSPGSVPAQGTTSSPLLLPWFPRKAEAASGKAPVQGVFREHVTDSSPTGSLWPPRSVHSPRGTRSPCSRPLSGSQAGPEVPVCTLPSPGLPWVSATRKPTFLSLNYVTVSLDYRLGAWRGTLQGAHTPQRVFSSLPGVKNTEDKLSLSV